MLICILYCQSAHRDLHSFPTRRSSDLMERIDPFCRTFGTGWWPEEGGEPRDGCPAPHKVASSSFTSLRRVSRAFRYCRNIDRKSTRLNSSHRCISYAVFCLKKKNMSDI